MFVPFFADAKLFLASFTNARWLLTMENYKSAKEAFVSNMTGSSVGHINLLSLAALVR